MVLNSLLSSFYGEKEFAIFARKRYSNKGGWGRGGCKKV
jgi:hypothetical protein